MPPSSVHFNGSVNLPDAQGRFYETEDEAPEMPTVPQDRADEAYFAPVAELQTGIETELSFGLVPYHPDAQGRSHREDVPALLDLHATILEGGR